MAIASSRLLASQGLLKRPCLHAYPARAYFCSCKSRQNTVKGDRASPLTNPFLSLAVLDTNLDFSGAKNPNPYCAQIRSQGSRRRICPLPVPLPRSGGGAVWANSCLFKFRSRQRDFLRCTPWPIGSPHPNRRDPLSLQNRATNPSCTSPAKSTIYANITHKSPIL